MKTTGNSANAEYLESLTEDRRKTIQKVHGKQK
jgi:hypothetical protein